MTLDAYERFGVYAIVSDSGVLHVSDDPPRTYCGRVMATDGWVETHLLLSLREDVEMLGFQGCKTCQKVGDALLRQRMEW